MPKEFHRTERVAEAIQMELALLLRHEAKDPRFVEVTITEVRVTKDLANAKVFVAFISNDETLIKDVLKALSKAAGYFRTQLAGRMNMCTVPQLHFKHDNSFEYGSKLTSIIEIAVANDPPQDEVDE